MQPGFDLLQPVLEAPAHGVGTERQPFGEQIAQTLQLRPPVDADDVHVDPIAALQIRAREQMRHELFHVDAIGSRHDHESSGILVVRFVAQVFHQRQLFRQHLRRDLLQHPRAAHLVGKRRDDDVAVFLLITGAHAQRAVASRVHGSDVLGRRDDLRFGGKVRTLDMLAEIDERRFRLLQQAHASCRHFPQIVGRNVGRHADGDAGGAVQQHVGQTRGQHGGLVQGAVEIRHPIHGALAKLRQQHSSEAGETRLRVAHGGEGFRIVHRAPVSLPVDERITKRERLRHEHHGVVAGGLSVGMKLAEHVAHRARRLLVLRARVQTELRHRVDDAPLHRFEAVADMRQGAIEDHVHGVIQVRFLGEILQRDAFDGFVQLLSHGL